METKIDKIGEHLAAIRIDIAEIRKDIQYHIRRTDLAEESINLLREELRPIEKHVERVNGAVKLFLALGLIITLVKAFIEFT